jgi:hypothetical protein
MQTLLPEATLGAAMKVFCMKCSGLGIVQGSPDDLSFSSISA